jgi:hypothetical protein
MKKRQLKMIHKQSYIKVNVPVDHKISSLVTALSKFTELETIESCEGTDDKRAWVCFRYGKYWEHPWHDLSNFMLGFMAPQLTSMVGDDVNIRIQITGSGQIFGELSIRPGAIRRVEKALYSIARKFTAHLYHSSVCCGDMSDTLQLHC